MSIITRFNKEEFARLKGISNDLDTLLNIKKLYTAKIVLASLMSYEYEIYLELLDKAITVYTKVLKEKSQVSLYISEEDITTLYTYIHRIANETII